MTNEKMWIADTNFLYDGIEQVIDTKKIVLMSTVRFETDKHKTAIDKDLQYKARKVNRFIFDNYDKFHHDVGEYNPEVILGLDYSKDVMDYRILACAKVNDYGILTNDLNLYSTAKAFNVEVKTLAKLNGEAEKEYTGIRKIYVKPNSEDEEKFASIYQDISNNPYKLLTNEYIIFYDKETPIEHDEDGYPTKYKVLDKFRYDGKKMHKLKLPHKKVVQARNEEQECAIDLLNNDDIPIKFIIGVSGSGKTKLSAKLGIHKVLDTGAHSKILAVRNPIGSGENIGFLKGTFEEKTDKFFEPIISCLKGGELEAALMEQRGQLEKHIPYFSKGLTWNDSYVLVDEAEDLSKIIIKLLGSRIGEDASIVFAGDYKQVEEKYSRNNGLIQAIEDLKGNSLVGVVSLSEDVRSEASKVFADLW
ncbi:PhoH family protein [Sporosarcina sp. FSL W7-1283]|uniref:PhoH family protein n=1 Tax=Sporosarcina sp. FSL W7-1283 TaxID=2921560 RepID=UPI0030F531D7